MSAAVLFILTLLGCKTTIVEKNNTLKKEQIESFDISSFRKTGATLNEVNTEIDNDTITERSEMIDTFVQTTYSINSAFKTKKSFYKKNLQLKAEANFFYDFTIGIARQYDMEGHLIEEKDWDKCCAFDVVDLMSKFKKEFNIDLSSRVKKSVVRGGENDKWIYIVAIQLSDNPKGDSRQIKVDAESGAILDDKVISYTE